MRKTLALVDQIVAGASNWLTTVLVATIATPEEFGAFSRNLVLVIFAAGLGATIAIEPWISTRAARVNLATARRDASGVAAKGAVLAMVSAAAGALAIGGYHRVWLLIALVTGALVAYVNGTVRLACLACGQIGVALVADTIWLVATPTLILFPLIRMDPWLAWMIGGIISTAALLVAAERIAGLQSPTDDPAITPASVGWSYAVDFGLAQLVSTGSILALAVFSGDAAVGAFNGTFMLFTPANLAFNSARTIGVPFVTSRLSHHATPRVRRNTALSYLVPSLVGFTVMWVGVIFVISNRFGSRVMPQIWPSVAPLRGLASVVFILAAFATATVLSLRVARMGPVAAIGRAIGVFAGGLLLVVLGMSPRHLLIAWALYFMVTTVGSLIISSRRVRRTHDDGTNRTSQSPTEDDSSDV